ncbi:MAG: CocE/NonD family hydrolase [Chitinophagaceae bacterium]|nr:CocE/NonD family hydrolase [Chitinophagaceae bacterium]
MKKTFIALLLVLSFSAVRSQNADSLWTREHYYKIERMIPMRDGAKLFTAFYIPKDSSERHPILFNRTPYTCYPYGEDQFNPRLYMTYWLNYLKKGYIIAIQDVRGKWMSEGDFVDVRPFNPDKKGKEIDEASDTYDAIDWMVNHIPGNNNRVGVMGISYPGFYSTMAALSGHPALKAVSPQAPVTDWFQGDDFHHNGAFFIMDGFGFYSGFGKPRPKPTKEWSQGYRIPSQDNYDFYLKTGALKNFSKIMGDSIAFWKDLYAHPDYDDWWKARNPRNFVTNVKPAVLVVGGLFDAEDCFGAWSLYKAIETKSGKTDNRLVMGPWVHGGWGGRGDGSFLGNVRFGDKTSEYYQQNIEIPFFEYHLRSNGGVQDIAEANIYFSGENKWRKLDQWPPKNVTYKKLILHANGKLSFENEQGPNAYYEYISDPAHPVPYTEDVHLGRTTEYMTDDQRFASRRTDVLSFTTDILDQDISLGGPLVADLMASLSTTDADFVVKLIDVFPDEFQYDETVSGKGNGKDYPMGGYQMLVRGEIMRGKYRNSFEKPIPFVPGKVSEVKYTLPDVAHTFKKGHRIMIQVQSSWFPLADRNPQKFTNIYQCDDSDFQKSTIRIHFGKNNQTSFTLPVIQ